MNCSIVRRPDARYHVTIRTEVLGRAIGYEAIVTAGQQAYRCTCDEFARRQGCAHVPLVRAVREADLETRRLAVKRETLAGLVAARADESASMERAIATWFEQLRDALYNL